MDVGDRVTLKVHPRNYRASGKIIGYYPHGPIKGSRAYYIQWDDIQHPLGALEKDLEVIEPAEPNLEIVLEG